MRRASLSAHRASEVGDTRDVWSGDTGNLTVDDLTLLADLRLADQRGELSLAYQPQLSTKTGRIESVEALLRWNSPRHGSVSPGRFIVLAERTGLIEQLTWWVVAEALDAQRVSAVRRNRLSGFGQSVAQHARLPARGRRDSGRAAFARPARPS